MNAPPRVRESRTALSAPLDNPFVDDDDPDGQPPPTNDQSGSALRKWAKEQQKLAKDFQAKVAELTAKLAQREASEVFTELGISEKVRKFYQGEPTKEAIKTWWTENADVFGIDPGVGQDPTLDDAQQQHQRDIDLVQQAAQVGQDRTGAVSREQMSQARQGLLTQKNSNIADLNAALAKMGVPDTPLLAPQF